MFKITRPFWLCRYALQTPVRVMRKQHNHQHTSGNSYFVLPVFLLILCPFHYAITHNVLFAMHYRPCTKKSLFISYFQVSSSCITNMMGGNYLTVAILFWSQMISALFDDSLVRAIRYGCIPWPGARFTNFFLAVQIRWKIRFYIMQLFVIRLC